jgi:hypothetical protein
MFSRFSRWVQKISIAEDTAMHTVNTEVYAQRKSSGAFALFPRLTS